MTTGLPLLQELATLFASTAFWRKWEQVTHRERAGSTWVNYRLASHELEVSFYEHEGLVKVVSVQQDQEVLIDGLFFLNLEELTLLLSRVPSVRAANPYSTDSAQIKALSWSSRTADLG